MTNNQRRDLLASAIENSGLSARVFAELVLDVDERTVRRWQAGDRDIPFCVCLVCADLLEDPARTRKRVDHYIELANQLRDETPP